ncbi:SulP family inorganic anion transporter [Sulfurimonas sp. HSL-3221]|uniref:SulP family inorganic anion transporter n=1 Tax=Thiomicrolovo sulfuroxydans TaxID=2894755 RepID=UPI001E427047|nr:SulP family inorganic anion transporter [Sulfurimonas sp. HSL-3221]UFS63186.1 SulP family inorganic anion transporter [Sulfurimonas sp. HSL-3221]
MFNLQNYRTDNIKNDVLSGLVVAVALVPEAIAFAFIAEVSPIVGLYTAFILGLITALIGGKPGMISGATGSVAVVLIGLTLEVSGLLRSQGLGGEELAWGVLQYVTLAALLTGAIQILFGVFKMGKFIRLVPQPAMYGFVNGLAIVIATAQFKFFEGEGVIMYALVAITMLIMFVLPRYTKAVPAGLVAIVALTLVAYLFGLQTGTVGDMANLSAFKGQLPSFHIPDFILDPSAILVVLPYAVIMALVGLIESLLTLAVLDEMSGTRGSGNQECIALGTGNMTCGLFGGMPGCAMIGQSIINYTSGGLGRLSGVTAAVGLMVLVASLTDVLNVIPIAVLVGIMFMVSIGTFEWSSFSHLKYMPRSDAFVMVAVTLITIVEDLAIAVISGVIISALVFAWKHARIYAKSQVEADGTKVYELDGPLFFGSTASFFDAFTIDRDPPRVVIDFQNARVMDASGVEAIDTITRKYEDANKQLTLRHLSEDCKKLLKAAGPHCTYEVTDPTYKVAVNL